MVRSTFKKVMWVGRATVFLVGLAVILALVFGAASAALGANGQAWILGQPNVATAITSLGGAGGVNGPMVRLTNNDADADDTALDLRVQSGEAPMRVNSATRVANLNAATAGRADSAASAGTAANADSLDGKDFSAFDVDELVDSSGPLPKEATFNSEGGTLVFSTSGSGFRASNNSRFAGAIAMRLLVDGSFVDRIHITINEQDHREPFVAQDVVVGGLPAGSHTVRLEEEYSSACNTDNETFATLCTSTSQNDRFSLTLLEMPAE
jgi:hypothetical protein